MTMPSEPNSLPSLFGEPAEPPPSNDPPTPLQDKNNHKRAIAITSVVALVAALAFGSIYLAGRDGDAPPTAAVTSPLPTSTPSAEPTSQDDSTPSSHSPTPISLDGQLLGEWNGIQIRANGFSEGMEWDTLIAVDAASQSIVWTHQFPSASSEVRPNFTDYVPFAIGNGYVFAQSQGSEDKLYLSLADGSALTLPSGVDAVYPIPGGNAYKHADGHLEALAEDGRTMWSLTPPGDLSFGNLKTPDTTRTMLGSLAYPADTGYLLLWKSLVGNAHDAAYLVNTETGTMTTHNRRGIVMNAGWSDDGTFYSTWDTSSSKDRAFTVIVTPRGDNSATWTKSLPPDCIDPSVELDGESLQVTCEGGTTSITLATRTGAKA